MDADERRCPSCGHDVISWEVTCPGCEQVPWDTPQGRRVLRGRRGWSALMENGPLAALLLLALVLAVLGAISGLRLLGVL